MKMQVRGVSPIQYRTNLHNMPFPSQSFAISHGNRVNVSPNRPPSFSQSGLQMMRTPDRPLSKSNITVANNKDKNSNVPKSPNIRNHILSYSNKIIQSNVEEEGSKCIELSNKIKDLEAVLKNSVTSSKANVQKANPIELKKLEFNSKLKEKEYRKVVEELEKKVESLLVVNEKNKDLESKIYHLTSEIGKLNDRLVNKENEIQILISSNSQKNIDGDEIANLESKIEELLEENENINLLLRDKDLEIEELSLAIQNRNEMDLQDNYPMQGNMINPELERKIEALMEENTAMTDLISTKVQELNSKEEEIKRSKKECETLHELNNTLKQLNEELGKKAASNPQKCNHYDYDENMQLLKDYESKIETLIGENDKINHYIERLEKELDARDYSANEQMNLEIEELKNRNSELESKLQTKEIECHKIYELNKSFSKRLEETEYENKEEVTGLNNHIKSQKERIQYLEQELQHQKRKFETQETSKGKKSEHEYKELEKKIESISKESLELISQQKLMDSQYKKLQDENIQLKHSLSNSYHEPQKENVLNPSFYNLQIDHWKSMYEQQREEFQSLLIIIQSKKRNNSPSELEKEIFALSSECEELRVGLENCAAAYEEAVSELNEKKIEVDELNGKYCEAMALISEMERRFIGNEE